MSMQSVLNSFFQFQIVPMQNPQGFVYVLGSASEVARKKEFKKIIEIHALDHQKKSLLASDKRQNTFTGLSGPVWILQNATIVKGQHDGLLDESLYGWFRDQGGGLLPQFKSQGADQVLINFLDCTEEMMKPVMIGLELAAYNFLSAYNAKQSVNIKINLQSHGKIKISKSLVESAHLEARVVQIARHLVNLPPNDLNPDGYEKIVTKELNFPKTLQVSVWDHKKLAAENMNLMLATGKGATSQPRMIHLKYRPKKASTKKPIAFVGKGITFDTGGLDMKPSSGMRLMKKDMGGSAAVLALAYWVAYSNYSRPCDFYLALAENAVDAASMRPSDLYRSRAGYLVEIDNTDAEGRLVLADAMDVAVTQKGKDEPEIVVDIATLTGAIKVALGADVAGLFTNNDVIAQQMMKAGQKAGEPNWRIPLVQKYFGSMSSNFADFKNSADGFGGAITAALFLEKFCRGKKWVHLDVYCWTDKSTGALSSAGGSGQPVQSMIEWLKVVG
ncbi:MAG: leucyl aminopeptidase family protein [Bdellovibrio sp.]|nr:leucyl aminopeptidase family protein [Bdellovibrio sp.]